MRIFLAVLAFSKVMALCAEPSHNIERPRITHNLLWSHLFSYPSTGGFVRKRITRVELDWLGVNLLTANHDNQSGFNGTQAIHNPEDEDSLALHMIQLGAHWWPSTKFFDRHADGHSYGIVYAHHYPPDLDIGYPETGGVLVLRTWADNSPYPKGFPGVPPEKPDEWSRLSLCATMQERCNVMRDFGAEFYERVEDCPDVPKSLEQGIAMGRDYERLLKKMEDNDYVTQWMDSL